MSGEASSLKPSLVAPLPDQLVSEHRPVPLLLNTPPSFDDHLLRPDTASRLSLAGIYASANTRDLTMSFQRVSSPGESTRPPPAFTTHWRAGSSTEGKQTFRKGQTRTEKQLYHHKNTFQKQFGFFPLKKKRICKKDTLNTMPVQSGYFSMGVFVFSHIFHEHEDKNNITTMTYL